MNNNVKSLFLINIISSEFIFILLFLFFQSYIYAETDNKIIKVGVYDNEPKVFLSSSGEPAGLFIDIIEYIANKEGWKINYVPGTWGDGLNRLKNGEIDLMPDVAYTAEREKLFSFHKVPVLSSWFQVYARKGSDIQSILDLDNKKISVLERSIQAESFSHLANDFGLNLTLITLPDYKSCFEVVAKGEADAVITNRFYGIVHAERYRLENTAVIFNPSTLFFAAPGNSDKELLNTIDSYLNKLKKDTNSVYYSSLKRWISEDIKYQIPEPIKIISILLIFLLSISLLGIFLFKHQLKIQTAELSKHNDQMLIIEKTLRTTTTQLELNVILNNFLQGVLELSCYQSGMINLIDPDTGNLVRAASLNMTDKESFNNNISFELIVNSVQLGVLFLFSEMKLELDYYTTEQINNLCSTISLSILNARLYRKILNHETKLKSQVKERTAELKKAMEEAKAADKIKSAFLATMSHELRTPLNSIIGFTGIMLQEIPGPLNEEQEKQMSMVQVSARHLLALINDVLDISKIEAGQLALSISIFDVKSSIEKVINMILPQIQKKGLELRIDISDDVKTSLTDSRRFEQIILNLLTNAVKFTEKGFISLTCRSEKNHYFLSVSDSGIGIDSKNISGLFKPFHQVDTGLTRKHEGTGLGLSICKKLLDLMNGSIDIKSESGRGSTFSIRFPGTNGVL